MKVGIVTLHRSFSYGASLQAYATYRAIKSLGHEAELVNYVNDYEQDQNRLVSRKRNTTFRRRLLTTFENIFLGEYVNKRKAFIEFSSLYPLSQSCHNKEELEDLSYDVLLSGSDQLWNPDIFGGIDEVYFLNFGKAKKIAYAASAGSHIFKEDERRIISPWISDYDALAVREEFLKSQIEDMTDKEIKVVVDPSFLLSRDEWLEFAGETPVIKGEYILLYMIGVPYKRYKAVYAPVVRYFAELLRMPVYAIASMSFPKRKAADVNLTGVTPSKLVNLINASSLVITSSFHGIAFSLNMNKKFVALQTVNNARIDQLLKICKMEERLIDGLDRDKCESLIKPLDFSTVNEILRHRREESMGWLKENLSI